MDFIRGDTQFLKFQRKDAEGNVISDTPNEIYLTAKKDYRTSKIAFKKTITDFSKDDEDYWHVTITPEDTKNLEYGEYFFGIKVITDDYEKTIHKGKFNLTVEIS